MHDLGLPCRRCDVVLVSTHSAVRAPLRLARPFRPVIRRAATVRPGTRIPQLAVPALAFGAYLVAVAGLTAFDADRLVGVAVLMAVAAAAGAGTTPLRAAAVGAFGWFFWSGFVVHDAGRLGAVGLADLAALIGLATSAVIASVIVGLNRD